MISEGEKYHYLAITNLSGLLQVNSSNHEGEFYCINCFNSYTSKNKHKEKIPFEIYLDLECTLKKLQSTQDNPEKSYTEKRR